ncbi:hypothetical protein ACFX1R_001179 [Malus domestica]
MKDHRIDGVRRRMGFVDGFNVALMGRAGGFSLWWDASMEVNIIFFSKLIIDVRFRELGEQSWVRFTGVYGTSYKAEKEEFWGWMNTHFSPSTIPWLCGGDFNEYL